ncbi:uncharacterized protein LOC112344204 [Selaginella moellendorffii]|uniref:uncharacterized protein LOC112344204 n=1 Tax=Selaginella moellendorffii TaxID=88036 RepID=UPI000D1C27AD|nr:uncharacterized protein LOC112344204 [Selaginella moellendorffii]|eukprot:XP_024524284.1 uncharacterized protein LOC112344204 [Selaginella moellendorffii]
MGIGHYRVDMLEKCVDMSIMLPDITGCGETRQDRSLAFSLTDQGAMAILYFDGACSGNGTGNTVAGYGFVLVSKKGNVIFEGSDFFAFGTTSNQAEYRGLIAGLQKAQDLGIRNIHIRGDSELVVNQVLQRWRTRNPLLQTCLNYVHQLLEGTRWEIEHVPRESNRHADSLARQGLCKTQEDYSYGREEIVLNCQEEDSAWLYVLSQRVHGYWRIRYILDVLQEEVPHVFNQVLDRADELQNEEDPECCTTCLLVMS